MFAAFAPLMLAAATLGTPDDAEKGFLGVQIKNSDSGVEIQAIIPDSPADKAGLRKDDVIVKINGEDAGNVQGFVQTVGAKKPGDKIKLKIKRDGQDKEIEVTLGKMPDQGQQ
jgi:serine protease Do